MREGRVRVPAGVGLDFGGIAKGFAVDTAAAGASVSLPWALVEAGGDLRVVGHVPAEGVAIGIEDPDDPEREVARVAVTAGAMATSSVTRRAWGPSLHHIIDPRTGLPASTGVVQASVWASTCTEAEILATEALLSGPDVLRTIPGVMVMEDRRVLVSVPRGGQEVAV